MRTSEVPGADALGFRVGKEQAGWRLSQVSFAVAAMAFLSACLFIAYDAARSLEYAGNNPAFETSMPISGLAAMGTMSRASLIGETGPNTQVFPAAQHDVLAGIAGRGFIAFALAGFITIAASRRRNDDVSERERVETMFLNIKEEQRLLARRYHEEKLKAEAANRAKTNFLAHVSHDIRTPLNHIIGFAELMEYETYGELGDTRYRDYVQSIKSSGQHLLNSFATILDLVELESGQKNLRQDIVLLDEVLSTVTRRFQDQINRAGIKFKVGPATGAVLRGDRLGLTRMVGNMIDNAIRFTRSGGTIILGAYAADDGVVIEISDTGIGMSEERLASLSQPFAMGDATFARNGCGPGLGISIARAIAEQSGGHLAIDSAPSLGTTVAISLPTEPAAAELAA
jgi:signal transduction histidine kinase